MKSIVRIATTLFYFVFFAHQLSSQALKDSIKISNYLKKAETFKSEKKYDSAIVYSEKASKFYRKKNDWENLVSNDFKISAIHYEKSETDISYRKAKNALVLLENKNIKQKKLESKILIHIGKCLYDKANYNDAVEIFLKALGTSSELKRDINLRLGRTYSALNKLELALKCYDKVLEDSTESTSNPEEHSALLNNIAVVYLKMGNMEKGTIFLKKAIDNLERICSKSPLIASCYNNLGNVARIRENLFQSEKYYKDGINHMLKFNKEFHPYTASLYNNLSVNYRKKGAFESALVHAKKSILIKRKIHGENHNKIANAYTNISNLYQSLGNLDKAIEFQKKSLNINTKVFKTFHRNTSQNYNNLGDLYKLKNQYNEAKNYYRKSLINYRKSLGKNHHSVSLVYSNLSQLCFVQKKFDEAESYILKAINISQKKIKSENASIADYYNKLAQYKLAKGEYQMALKFCNEALLQNKVNDSQDQNVFKNPFVGLNTKHLIFNIHREQYEQKCNLKFLEKSLKVYEETHTIISNIRKQITYYNDRIKLSERSNQVYKDAIAILYILQKFNPDRYSKIFFDVLEKSKASTLSDYANNSIANHNQILPDSILSYQRKLKIDKASHFSKIAQERSKQVLNNEKIQQYENLIFTITQKEDSIQDVIRKCYPKYWNVKYASKITPRLDTIQRMLDAKTKMLQFSAHDSLVYVAVVTKNSFETKKIEIPKLRNKISNFQNAISNKNQFNELSHGLYKLLMEPLVDLQTDENLLIIPDEELWRLPYDLFLTRKTSSKNPKELPYLLKSVTITYLNSATTWYKTKKENPNANERGECIAFSLSEKNSISPNNDAPVERFRSLENELPGTGKEVKAIAKILDGEYVFGTETSEKKFKEQAPNYKILHLALHGAVDEESPENSRLYFSKSKDTLEDNMLYSHELLTMNIPAELAVLSACNTGSGRIAKGEGIMSLGSAFQYAGVKSLLLSRWEISDQTTPELMQNFYQNLKSGMNKAKALRKAKLDYLNTSDVSRSYPLYWSGFYLLGNNDQIHFRDDAVLSTILASVIFCLLLAFIFIFVKNFKKVKTPPNI